MSKKPEIEFYTSAEITDPAMWSTIHNISILGESSSADLIIQLDEEWDGSPSRLNVSVKLIEKLEDLKEYEDEFEPEDLDILKSYLEKAKEGGANYLTITP